MQIIDPDIINHNDRNGQRQPIYSCDIQPFGNRLATAGGGNKK